MGQLIIVILKFINNRKNVDKKLGIVLMIMLISIAIGLGFIVLFLPKFVYYDTDSMQYIETSQEFETNDKTVFIDLCDWSRHITKYIEDDRDNILVKVKHYKNNNVTIKRYDNDDEFVIGDYVYIYTEMNNLDFKFIREFIKNINNYKLVNYDKYEIYFYGNKENLDLIKKRADSYCNGLD